MKKIIFILLTTIASWSARADEPAKSGKPDLDMIAIREALARDVEQRLLNELPSKQNSPKLVWSYVADDEKRAAIARVVADESEKIYRKFKDQFAGVGEDGKLKFKGMAGLEIQTRLLHALEAAASDYKNYLNQKDSLILKMDPPSGPTTNLVVTFNLKEDGTNIVRAVVPEKAGILMVDHIVNENKSSGEKDQFLGEGARDDASPTLKK